MHPRALFVGVAFSVSVLLGSPPSGARADARLGPGPTPTRAAAAASLASLPLRFEENRGQVSSPARYLARARGFTLFVAPAEAVIATRDGGVLRMRVEGAVPVEPRASERLPGITNYFLGNDPARWLRDVPGFGVVEQKGVLPGVDLVFRGSPTVPEYDLRFAPGTEPALAVLSFEGAERLSADGEGDLVVSLRGGEVRHGRPRAWQDLPGGRLEVPARFAVLGDRRAGFTLGEYDRTRPLLIDPTLTYSTYFGGGSLDLPAAVVLDASGNVCFTGDTFSTDFPLASAYQSSIYCTPGPFLTKVDSSGTSLVFSTYFGGTSCPSSYDSSRGLAIDGSGRIVVGGRAATSNFPVLNPLQSFSGHPNSNAFVSVFSADGRFLLFSTTLGGSTLDWGNAVAVGTDGSIFVCGETDGFPVTAGAWDTTLGGARDGFAAKVNSAWSAVSWATYLGGSTNYDVPRGIAVDSQGGVLVAGYTASSNFPLQTPFQSGFASSECFLLRLATDGDALSFSTFVGGSADEEIHCMALDSQGGVLVGGLTYSSDFPVENPAQGSLSGYFDGFAARVLPDLSGLDWSTYLGGPSSDGVDGIAAGSTGTTWVTGFTDSTTFPLSDDALQEFYGGGSGEGFVARIASGGGSFLYSSYCGGSGGDWGSAIAVGSNGAVWVVGGTWSTNFAVTGGAYQSTKRSNDGSSDAFLQKITPDDVLPPPPPPPPSTLPPAPPGGLVAVATSPTSISLSWADRSDNEIAFGIVRSEEGGSSDSMGTVPPGTVSWADEGLDPDRTYAYRVRSIGIFGASLFTDPAEATTPATLTVALSRAVLTDAEKPGKDHARLEGSWTLGPASLDGVFDPVLEGFQATFGDGSGTVLVTIPPEDDGWKVKGGRWTWKSPRSSFRKVKFSLDPEAASFSFSVSGLELRAPAADSQRLRLISGNDAGSTDAEWTPHPRKEGVFFYP